MKTSTKIIIGIVISILIITGGIFLFFKLKYECGDRVCELHELGTCQKDCKPECSYQDYKPYIKLNNRIEIMELFADQHWRYFFGDSSPAFHNIFEAFYNRDESKK